MRSRWKYAVAGALTVGVLGVVCLSFLSPVVHERPYTVPASLPAPSAAPPDYQTREGRIAGKDQLWATQHSLGGATEPRATTDPSPLQPVPPAHSASSDLAPGAVDDALKRLASGVVAFNVPSHMRLGRTQTVDARVGVSALREQLVQELGLHQPDTVKTAELRISPRMQATLQGGNAFDILPAGAQVQFVSMQEGNIWSWQVTPKLEGQQELRLVFDVLIEVNGKEGTHTVNSLSQPITVEVGWPETPREWAEATKRWVEYGGWLWSALLLPVGAFVASKWTKRSSSSAPVPKDLTK